MSISNDDIFLGIEGCQNFLDREIHMPVGEGNRGGNRASALMTEVMEGMGKIRVYFFDLGVVDGLLF